jgi:hypothetical protein
MRVTRRVRRAGCGNHGRRLVSDLEDLPRRAVRVAGSRPRRGTDGPRRPSSSTSQLTGERSSHGEGPRAQDARHPVPEVEHQLPKVNIDVRTPSAAPV